MAVPILQREITQIDGFDWFSMSFTSSSPRTHDVLSPSSFSLFLPPGPHWLPNLVLVFSLWEKSMHRRGWQPLALIIFFRVTQEVTDSSTHHARPRPPTPPPSIVPIRHLPAVPQGWGRANGVGPAQASCHGCLKGECLLLATVRGVGVFMEGQIGLRDVVLWGRVLALLGVQGVGRLGQASAVALQGLRGQWGSSLTSIRRWRDATSVSHQGAVR